jgi:hypothetical protein
MGNGNGRSPKADRLLDLAARLEARVILVGDIRQHHAVERGQAFDHLKNHPARQTSALGIAEGLAGQSTMNAKRTPSLRENPVFLATGLAVFSRESDVSCMSYQNLGF